MIICQCFTIHCFFVHSVDIGHRIIQSQINDDDNKEEESKDESKAYDANMARMRRYLRSKREKLETIRGGRFMTLLQSKRKFMTHVQS